MPDLQEKKASDFYWYHSIDLGNGQRVKGDYDMEEYLPHYHFPADMSGMSVLDVGRASGFFAFEFERRGAKVTATEIRSVADWDFLGGDAAREERLSAYLQDNKNFDEYMIRGAFFFAHKQKKSKVTPVDASIYELSPDLFGGKKFDLVFAGSLTSHLKHPILAFERLLSVTGGTCIVAAPSLEVEGLSTAPLISFVGKQTDSDKRSWWVYTPAALEEALYAAGFTKVKVMSTFVMKNDGFVVPHIIAHATANELMETEEYFNFSSEADVHNFILSGFNDPEDWGCWTKTNTSSIRFLEMLPDSFELQLDVKHIVAQNIGKALTITIGNIKSELIVPAPGTYTLQFKSVGKAKEILLYTPSVHSPNQNTPGSDQRTLGLGLKSIKIVPLS